MKRQKKKKSLFAIFLLLFRVFFCFNLKQRFKIFRLDLVKELIVHSGKPALEKNLDIGKGSSTNLTLFWIIYLGEIVIIGHL